MRCLSCSSEFLELELMDGRCIACWRSKARQGQIAVEHVLPELRRLSGQLPKKPKNAFQQMVDILEQVK